MQPLVAGRRVLWAGADRGRDVIPVGLTAAGAEFVTPLALASLSGERVFTDLFSLTDEAEIGHIRLSREADIILVAPATADIMAKMTAGLADDLATTALLATDSVGGCINRALASAGLAVTLSDRLGYNTVPGAPYRSARQRSISGLTQKRAGASR